MLRGRFSATIDGKGRLKIPSAFQRPIREKYGEGFFITSFIWGAPFVRLYPMQEWEKVEEKLSRGSDISPKGNRLVDVVSYYGQTANMDKQGRILIPQTLRDEADMKGEVAVFGKFNRLEIWNEERFLEKMNKNPLTEEDLEELSRQIGI